MHYENAIILFTFLVYVLSWALLIGKIRRNALSLLELILKTLAYIPFWLGFIFIFLSTTVPQVDELLHQINSTQKIILNNDTQDDVEYYFYLRDSKNKEWEYAFPLGKPLLSNKISLERQEKFELYFRADERFNALRIEMKGNSYPEDKVLAKAFKMPATPIKLFTTDFEKSFSKPISINNSERWRHLIIYLLAIFGVWYHPVTANRKKTKIALYSFAGIITAISLTMLFFTLKLLL